MANAAGLPVSDQPFFDTTAYGAGPGDSVPDATENAAITRHVATSRTPQPPAISWRLIP